MPGYIIRQIIRKLPGKVISLVPKPEPELIQGFGTCSEVGVICTKQHLKRVLLVTDSTLYRLEKHLALCESLHNAGIKFEIYSGISAEPDTTVIDKGRKAAQNIDAQGIIALGGGSVMDASKMIAAGMKFRARCTRSLLLKFLPVRGGTLPMINVPTTAGTGAQITVGAVISNGGKKSSTVIIGLKVVCVILDGSLSIGAPVKMTAACGIDALSHGLEGVVADIKSSKQDVLKSMDCVRMVLANLPSILAGSSDEKAWQEMCLAAHYGGNAINVQLAGYVHAFAHSIGARYHIPHGQAIAMCLLPVMKQERPHCEEKLQALSRHCGFGEDVDALFAAIESLVNLCSFDAPAIPREDFGRLARMISLDSINYSAPNTLNDKHIHNILKILGNDRQQY